MCIYIYNFFYWHIYLCIYTITYIYIYVYKHKLFDLHVYIDIYMYIMLEVTTKITPVWCARFKRAWKWSHRRNNTTGNYLPYNAPQMQAYRMKFKAMVETQGVHPRLILNYDQVWAMQYAPPEKTLWKDSFLHICVYDVELLYIYIHI